MPITVTVRLKNDTGLSAIDRLTGDATLTGVRFYVVGRRASAPNH
jgi:hypothetical protein